MNTFEERYTQERQEPKKIKTIGTHERQMQRYTQQWQEPQEQLREQERSRKRLAIVEMEEQVESLQKRISTLRSELNN